MNISVPHVLIIFGPTGVGKTDLSLHIGHRLPIEIINMDMGQFYTPLTIGTAKPEWQKEFIVHHLFDIITTPLDYTVMQYRTVVLTLIKEISERGILPVLVGGSGFYLRSLFFPPHMVEKSFEYIPLKRNNEEIDTINKDLLWESLYVVDPVRAVTIHKNDVYRIKRALSIWYNNEVLPSHCIPMVNIPFTYDLLYVSRDRSELYERINKRVLIMLKAGWLDEVRQLIGTEWEAFIHIKKIIGYNEILAYLSGDLPFDLAVATIQKRTRNYAKRQETYWRYFARELITADVNLGQLNHISSLPISYLNGNNYVDEFLIRHKKKNK